MSSRSRTLLLVASLVLGLVYVLPLWRVTLDAPQYPGGLGMQIWVDTITGLNPHDLQNINGLNHYIGMQEIVPESIPELDIIPWLFGGLILFGLIAAALRKRALLFAWIGLFVVLLVIGFVDYYQWGYDYGHNLSPDAAIKIPGMAYQPPLIGSKQMLNFVAHSLPDLGGIVIFISLLMGLTASVQEFRKWRFGRKQAAGSRPVAATQVQVAAAALLGVGLIGGCRPAPQPLVMGETACAHCRMTVSDARYGAELVASTGKVYPFDAIECLTAYLADEPEAAEAAHSLWVAAFDVPGTLVNVKEAYFFQSQAIHSPMGGGLAAYTTAYARDEALVEQGGTALDWGGVLTIGNSGDARTHALHVH